MEQSGTRFTEKRPVASKKKRLERDRFKDGEIRGWGDRNEKWKTKCFFFFYGVREKTLLYIYIYEKRNFSFFGNN